MHRYRGESHKGKVVELVAAEEAHQQTARAAAAETTQPAGHQCRVSPFWRDQHQSAAAPAAPSRPDRCSGSASPAKTSITHRPLQLRGGAAPDRRHRRRRRGAYRPRGRPNAARAIGWRSEQTAAARHDRCAATQPRARRSSSAARSSSRRRCAPRRPKRPPRRRVRTSRPVRCRRRSVRDGRRSCWSAARLLRAMISSGFQRRYQVGDDGRAGAAGRRDRPGRSMVRSRRARRADELDAVGDAERRGHAPPVLRASAVAVDDAGSADRWVRRQRRDASIAESTLSVRHQGADVAEDERAGRKSQLRLQRRIAGRRRKVCRSTSTPLPTTVMRCARHAALR